MVTMELVGKQLDGLFQFLASSCLLDHSAFALNQILHSTMRNLS
jgi:hypothetical protein